MLIRFWFGLIYVGRPSAVGVHRDAAVALCLGWRGDVPHGELEWHRIWRVSWNWLPDRVYQQIGAVAKPYTTHQRLAALISGANLSSQEDDYLLPIEFKNAIDSSRWTGRERRLVGFGSWQRELWIHRSNWRSKMYVYLTGSKERTGEHFMYVAPAAVSAKEDCPSDWLEGEEHKTPKQFAVKFTNGRASVEQNLGEWMIEHKYAQRTNMIRQPGKALLGTLANVIAGR